MELKYIRALLLAGVLAFALGTLVAYILAGDLMVTPAIRPYVGTFPISVTKIYIDHTADFQNYGIGDTFMEFPGTEPIGTIVSEQDPQYAGMKSLAKGAGQAGYMKYGRWRDLKLNQCKVSYNETIRITGGNSAYAYMTWQGMMSDNESYPHIQLFVTSGRFKINIREKSYLAPIASIDCGAYDTFPHKVFIMWSSSLIIIQFDEVYEEIMVPTSWTGVVTNSSRFNFAPNMFIRKHSMSLFGPEVSR